MNETMTSHSEDFIPTRYSLLSRLENRDDEKSWKEFFDTYWRLIYSTALKAGLTETEAQEVVQETVICVAKDIDKFKRDRALGSFKGWLKNLTRWRIADQLRKRRPEREPDNSAGTTMENEVPAEAELEKIWDEEWRSNLFEAAVERVKKMVKEEHYQIFDLNVVRNWPAGKVAETLGITVARVYLSKHRVRLLIRKEIRALEKQW
jgi:RNA polymerase sigma factor (sigma-70 family)